MSEEEQAEKVTRQTTMREIAWQAYCCHYRVFNAAVVAGDDVKAAASTQPMGYWLEVYQELTEGEDDGE